MTYVSEITLARPLPRQQLLFTKILFRDATYGEFRKILSPSAEGIDVALAYACAFGVFSTETEVTTDTITREELETCLTPADVEGLMEAVSFAMTGDTEYEPVGDGFTTPIVYTLRQPFHWTPEVVITGFDFKSKTFGGMRAFLTADGPVNEILAFFQGYATVVTSSDAEVPIIQAVLDKMSVFDIYTIRDKIMLGKFLQSRGVFKKR